MSQCPSKETCLSHSCPYQDEPPKSDLNGWILAIVAFSFFIVPLLLALAASLIWDSNPTIQSISALGGFCLGGLLNWIAMRCFIKQ